jgi:hypothetical protein
MGISNVAVKTFDSSGAQSLCRTNEYKGDEEVKSSFISKCQKLYISGSGETVIPGSLRTFPTEKSVDKFYVNSDTDAISEITLDVEFKFKRQSSGIKSLTVDDAGDPNIYSQNETVTLVQKGATGGTGSCIVVGGVLTGVFILTSGYGYNAAASGIEIKKSDGSGDAIGTATLLTDWNINVSKDIILGLIDKVEIKSGSLTVQTLTADDIYIRNLTELGQPFTFNAPFENPWKYDEASTLLWWNKEDQLPIGNRNVWKHATSAQDVIIFQASCSLPFIGRSKDMSRSLLQAGALTNALTITVHYNNLYSDNIVPGNSHYQIISAGDGFMNDVMSFNRIGTPFDFLDKNYFNSNIKVRTHIVTSTEKDFISKNIIHKVLNTSANVTKEITKNTSISNVTDGITEIEVDLENVSINVSHLLIGIRMPHVKNKKLSLHGGVTMPPFNVNLYNETQSNELSTPFSVITPQTYYEPAGNREYTSDAPDLLLGYMPNAIESMELVLGSDRTGFIKGSSSKIGTCENFNLINSDKNSAHYIITLAENAFDTAGVPFSKINNKKLLIKLNNYIFKTTGVAKNPLSDATYPQNAIITVTACGTKVQSVVGGSMSFL